MPYFDAVFGEEIDRVFKEKFDLLTDGPLDLSAADRSSPRRVTRTTLFFRLTVCADPEQTDADSIPIAENSTLRRTPRGLRPVYFAFRARCCRNQGGGGEHHSEKRASGR